MDNLSLAAFLLTLGAVARLSHLVVDDKITKPLRDALHIAWARGSTWDEITQTQKLTPAARLARFMAELTACVHCTSVWLAFPAAWALHLYGDTALYLILASALTLSYVTGLLALGRYGVETRTENLAAATKKIEESR